MSEKSLAKSEPNGSTELAVKQESAGFAAAVRHEVGIIAGVDDHNEHRYRFPRLGKLHLGVKQKTQGGKEYPKAVDYFVLPENLLADEGFMQVVADLNADAARPRKLPIQLVSHNIPDNVRSSLDLYGSNRGLKCRSWDGVTAQCVNEQTQEMETKPCLNVKCEHYLKGDCQVITRLRFFLPDAIGVGVWQLDTRSVNNRANLPCEMGTLRAAMNGVLAGVDLLLTLEPEEKVITVPGKDGKPQTLKREVWLLHLRSGLTMRQLKEQAASVNVTWSASDVEEMDTTYDAVVMDAVPVEDSDEFEVGEPPADEPTELRKELLDRINNLMSVTVKTDVVRQGLMNSVDKNHPIEEWSIDQLQALMDLLEKRAGQQAWEA